MTAYCFECVFGQEQFKPWQEEDGSREGIFAQGRDKNIGIEPQPHRADFA